MASGDLVRYVITVMLHEDTLTEINELNNFFFTLGTDKSKSVSPQLMDISITITTWEEWNSNRK